MIMYLSVVITVMQVILTSYEKRSQKFSVYDLRVSEQLNAEQLQVRVSIYLLDYNIVTCMDMHILIPGM